MTNSIKIATILPLTLAACLFITLPPAAADEPSFIVPKEQVHRIKSRFVDQVFEIRVVVPPYLEGAGERFAVMFVTDSNGSILFQDVANEMIFSGDVPRFISVGIGYPLDHWAGSIKLRSRDLSPTPLAARANRRMAPIKGVPTPTGKLTGGAPEFLRFIREELIPMIDASYPTVQGDRGFFGDSLGGLFGLYVLFNQPDTFNRYIIGSPATWWDNEVILKQADAYVAAHKDLPARLFLAAGSLEEVGAERAPHRMVTNIFRIEKLLRTAGFPGLTVRTHVFPDETHTSVAAMNYIRGLQSVYDRPEKSFLQSYLEARDKAGDE